MTPKVGPGPALAAPGGLLSEWDPADQDPIGLAGGTNLYEYAGSNPVSFGKLPYRVDS